MGEGRGRNVSRFQNVAFIVIASFAIIFSHSEGCLFTLLIVSFAVQKLLSLTRSHLFTFIFISFTPGGVCKCAPRHACHSYACVSVRPVTRVTVTRV